MRSPSTGSTIQIQYVYTDQVTGQDVLSITVADTWEKKALTPTAGKKIQRIRIYHSNVTYMECHFRGFWTVF